MESEALARAVIAKLRGAGHQAYLVGGSVRDLLLGAKPKDFDVSTDARPERIMELFPQSGQVGAHFGVVLVRDAVAQVEVATFRSDHEYADGRRPASVHFESDPREDVLRRDFTINGLMMEAATGKVLDYVGGRADLERRVVRAIGDPDARFGEDHLRLAARRPFRRAPGVRDRLRHVRSHGRHHALILKVSAERVREELTRILIEGGARRGFELLDASGMLADLLPEVAAMKGVAQPPEFHPEGDVWTHTLLLLEKLDHPTPTLAWGALLHDVGKPATFRVAERIRFNGHVEEGVKLAHGILNRLRFSRGDMEQVEALIANHMRFKDAHRMKQSTLKRFLRMPDFGEHLELHRLDCLAGNRNLENYELVRAQAGRAAGRAVETGAAGDGRGPDRRGIRPGAAVCRNAGGGGGCAVGRARAAAGKKPWRW